MSVPSTILTSMSPVFSSVPPPPPPTCPTISEYPSLEQLQNTNQNTSQNESIHKIEKIIQ